MSDGYPTLHLQIDFAETDLPWMYPIALNGRTVEGVYVDGVPYVPAENACAVEQTILNDYSDDRFCWYEHELSCGHKHYSGEKEPPRFCPMCGAYVLREERI